METLKTQDTICFCRVSQFYESAILNLVATYKNLLKHWFKSSKGTEFAYVTTISLQPTHSAGIPCIYLQQFPDFYLPSMMVLK